MIAAGALEYCAPVVVEVDVVVRPPPISARNRIAVPIAMAVLSASRPVANRCLSRCVRRVLCCVDMMCSLVVARALRGPDWSFPSSVSTLWSAGV